MTGGDFPARAGAIAVVGLGGVLMGDDAFGPYVVAVLEAGYDFPANVSVRDLGTPSLDLTAYLEELDALVVIDTVHSAGQPGELRTYDRAQILRHPVQPRVSPHEPGLKEALLIAEFDGRGPSEVLLIGAIPETTATGIGLSDALRASVPAAVEEVLKELRRLGAEATPKATPLTPDIWWEEKGGSTKIADREVAEAERDITSTTQRPRTPQSAIRNRQSACALPQGLASVR